MEDIQTETSYTLDNAESSQTVPLAENKENNTDQSPEITTQSVSEELIECFNKNQKQAVFFATWLKSGLNATKAYQSLHPTTSSGSARVLGSRMLRKVDISTILASYELSIETYMSKLVDGLGAVQWNNSVKDFEVDYKTRYAYLDLLGKLLQMENTKNVTMTIYEASTPQQDKLYQTNGHKALFRNQAHLELEILLRVKERGELDEKGEIALQKLLDVMPEYRETYAQLNTRFPRKPVNDSVLVAKKTTQKNEDQIEQNTVLENIQGENSPSQSI